MKHFLLLSFVALNLLEFPHISNISNEFRSERSCFAFSLPKSEARTRKWASRTASLARDTIQKEGKDTHYNIHVYPQSFSPKLPTVRLTPISHWTKRKKKNLKHTHLCVKTGSPGQPGTKIWNQSWSVFLKSLLSTTLFLLLGTE